MSTPMRQPIQFRVTPVPDSVRSQFNLAPFYKKYISAHGLPVISSEKVSDYALYEAVYLIDRMIPDRQDIFDALVRNNIRFSVMACSEVTTDIPEHSNLTPGKFWDMRARGLGAEAEHPSVSCGEENLLNYPNDHYKHENILIHEFAHTIHELGMPLVDPSFDGRLDAAYRSATARGLWKGTYAGSNHKEYIAVGMQAWFDCARTHSPIHNHVGTREVLKEYDPPLASLIREIVGEREWRYTRPDQRTDLGHLAGFDRSKAPTFQRDPLLVAWYEGYNAAMEQIRQEGKAAS